MNAELETEHLMQMFKVSTSQNEQKLEIDIGGDVR